MRSHSSVLIELERFVSSTSALPATRPKAASMFSRFDGFATQWQQDRLDGRSDARETGEHDDQ